jgi:hypothetical protein
MPVSDRKTLKGVTQFAFFLLSRDCKLLTLNGEMSEWLKEHAWKAISVMPTKRHRNTSSRNQFNDLPPQDVSRCDAVNDGVRRRFRPHLTQFLHSSGLHLFVLCRRILRYASVTIPGSGPDPNRWTDRLAPVSSAYFLIHRQTMMRVGAAGNRAPEPHDAISGLHPRMTMAWAPRP